jgi:hypothetical protein
MITLENIDVTDLCSPVGSVGIEQLVQSIDRALWRFKTIYHLGSETSVSHWMSAPSTGLISLTDSLQLLLYQIYS